METSLRMSFEKKIEEVIEARVNDWLNILIKMIGRLGPPYQFFKTDPTNAIDSSSAF